MSQSAYIKLVPGSEARELTLDAVRERLRRYREQTALTGRQLGWDYADAAFPYTIEPGREQEQWFYLKGVNAHYKHIIVGLSEAAAASGDTAPCIQVVLPDGSTQGDKGKAVELSKYMAKSLQAELTLFNGRTIYYNPRK